MENLAVRVENLSKSINETPILQGVNLQINKGERLCIVGHTGCGKTVLSKHLMGSLFSDSGEVYVLGQDLSKLNDGGLDTLRKKMGYVFQANALFGSMNVHDNLVVPLVGNLDAQVPRENQHQIEKTVRDALFRVGLEDGYLSRMPHELSGGQKKRVAIARAIITQPEIMIYDEPTVGLDPRYMNKIINLITDLHRTTGNTTIAITHQQELLEAIADRVVLLHNGKVAFDGNYSTFKNSESVAVKQYFFDLPV